MLLEHGLLESTVVEAAPMAAGMATSPGWEGSQHRARTGTNGEKHEGLKARRSVHTDTSSEPMLRTQREKNAVDDAVELDEDLTP